MRLTRQFGFQMAHALSGYDGKCRNIHGHNYRLFVTIEGEPIMDPAASKRGMVMDFSDLKRIVEEQVVAPLDHALVLAHDSEFPKDMQTKTIVTPFQPTCENMLLYFADLLKGKLPQGVTLYSLRLYETDNSYAELFL